MRELTRRGVQALKSGDKETARKLLASAILENRQDAQAWLWLSGAVESDAERIACLRQVQRLDPFNEAAARGLAYLEERRSKTGRPLPETPAGIPTMKIETVRSVAPAGEPTREIRVPAEGSPLEATHPVVTGAVLFQVRPSILPAVVGALAFVLVFAAAVYVLASRPLVVFLILLPAGLIGLKTVLSQFFERATEVYTLTPASILIDSGALHAQRRYLPLQQIGGLEYRRSLAAILMGTGDLLLRKPDGRLLLRLRDVHHYEKRLQQIQLALDKSQTPNRRI